MLKQQQQQQQQQQIGGSYLVYYFRNYCLVILYFQRTYLPSSQSRYPFMPFSTQT